MNCYEYIMTFEECMSVLRDTTTISLERFSIGKFATANNLSTYFETILTNAYSFDFNNPTDGGLSGLPFVEWDSTSSKWKFTTLFIKFLNFCFREYSSSYCTASPSENDSDLILYSTLFLDNFLNLVIATYDKYKTLYNLYNQEENLLKGVTTTYTEKGESKTETKGANSGYNKQKDTPQNEISIENLGDDYNTSVNVNSSNNTARGSATSSGTRTEIQERDTIIARLKEIEEKFLDLLATWTLEFQTFFWEVQI